MSAQGATLQNYNNELVSCTYLQRFKIQVKFVANCHTGIEDLREKREEVNRSILKMEEEKAKIQKVCLFISAEL